MSAKSCLLCGAPLGRIRVGAGEDFCSREHRNQYRLKRSMECLTEANKVATLARRRENPKPLFINAYPTLPGDPRAHTPARAFQTPAALCPELRIAKPRFRAQMAGPARLRPLGSRGEASFERASVPIVTTASPIQRRRPVKAANYLTGARVEFIPLRSAAPNNALRISSGTAFRPRLPRPSDAAGRIAESQKSPQLRIPGDGKGFLPIPSAARVRVAGERLGVTEFGFTTASEQGPRVEWVGVTDREHAQ